MGSEALMPSPGVVLGVLIAVVLVVLGYAIFGGKNKSSNNSSFGGGLGH